MAGWSETSAGLFLCLRAVRLLAKPAVKESRRAQGQKEAEKGISSVRKDIFDILKLAHGAQAHLSSFERFARRASCSG